MFQPLQGHLHGSRNLHLLDIHYLCLLLCYILHIVKYGCKVNADYEPPEDDLVRAETYVGVKE
jgi:hypothetical protein